MKNLFIILFILIGFTVRAQLPASTFKSRIFTGNTEASWIILDSPVVNPILDTFYARYPGTQIVRIQGGDTAAWFYGGNRHWFRSLQAPDTAILSNRINLKQNILSNTTGSGDTLFIGSSIKRLQNDYGLTFSTNATKILVFVDTLGSNHVVTTAQLRDTSIAIRAAIGGGGSGLTSIGLSMPSAFTVTNSPLTVNGTIAVSGAGTTSDYIRGNGTLATTDTTMIPGFSVKVRGLFSGSSPITLDQSSGVIGINNANSSGTKGAATFNNTDFTDNGAGLISLRNPSGGAGVDTIFRIPGIDSIYFTINSTQYSILDSAGSGGSGGTVTQVNTGYGLSGGPITLTGTIIVDTAALKSVYLPLNLNTSKTINQNTNNIFFTGGGEVKSDSFKISQTFSFAIPDTMLFSGNSFTFGLYATVPDSDYVHRMAAYYNLPLKNLAVSSTGIWHSVDTLNITLNPGHHKFTSVMAGYNNLRYSTGSTLNVKTKRMIINGYKSITASQFLSSYAAGGSSGTTGLTISRLGSWTTSYASNSVGGRGGTNGAYTTTANDTLFATCTSCNNFVVGGIGADAASGAGYNYSAKAYVIMDGVLIDSISESNQADGFADAFYDDKRSPMVWFFTGLSAGAHTMKIVQKDAGNYLIVDYIGLLKEAKDCTPLLLWHAAYDNVTGYAVSPANGSVAKTQTLNTAIDSLFTTWPYTSYPAYKVATNNCFDTLTGLYTDNIHPSDIGHRQLYQCGISALPTIQPTSSNGTITYASNGYYGTVNGSTRKFLLRGDTDSASYILNQNSYNQNANFKINGTGYVGTSVTAGNYSKMGGGLAQTDAATVFGVIGGNPMFSQYRSSAGTNEKIWDNYVDNTNMYFRVANDAMSSATEWLRVNRTGTTPNFANFNTTLSVKSTSPPASTDVYINSQSGRFPLILQTASDYRLSMYYFASINNLTSTNDAGTDGRDLDIYAAQHRWWNVNSSTFSERMRLTPAGSLLINRTSLIGTEYLSVNGNINATADSSGGAINILWMDVNGNIKKAAPVTGGIGTLNTLTATTQTFATGTSGSDFNISSATSTHTFNIPTASASNRGLLSTSDWTTFNGKVGNINSQTGAAQTIAGGTGISVSSGSNTHTISIDAAYITSGTYTPTLFNVAGVGASTAYQCQYMVVGNVVTVSGKVDIDPTATGTLQLGISLPVSSGFGASENCGGTAVAGGVSDLYSSIRADATNDRAEIIGTIPVTGSISNNTWYFTFTYLLSGT